MPTGTETGTPGGLGGVRKVEEGVAGGDGGVLVTLPNVMMTTETADHWDGLAFGFGLAQSGITRIHKRFWVLLFYFSTYYTSSAGFVASANISFMVLWVLCDSSCT